MLVVVELALVVVAVVRAVRWQRQPGWRSQQWVCFAPQL
jgi:hypothetical protein